jgi:hypothetical protein
MHPGAAQSVNNYAYIFLQFWFWEKFRLDRLDASIDYTGREAPLLQYWDEKKARKVCAILNEHGRDAGEVHMFYSARIIYY